MLYEPLSREEVGRVVEGRGNASRVPVLLHFWTHPEEFGDREADARRIMAAYPEDGLILSLRMPAQFDAPEDDPSYRWSWYDRPQGEAGRALDSTVVLKDWDEELDAFLADFPDADYPGLLPHNPPDDGRYRLGHWWFGLFEQLWSLRGMERALIDFYINPEAVDAYFGRLTDFFCAVITRAKNALNLDAIFLSDDLGTQNSTFFSPMIFDRFFSPHYERLIAHIHALGMHAWLHACGHIKPLLPKFIEMGLDVIHPIQKYTMDEREITSLFGGQIAFWAGFDVQRIIPWGTPEDVANEVKFMMDTYARPDGRFLFTAGNGINGDCPIESLERLYREAFLEGTRAVKTKRGGLI